MLITHRWHGSIFKSMLNIDVFLSILSPTTIDKRQLVCNFYTAVSSFNEQDNICYSFTGYLRLVTFFLITKVTENARGG